MPELIELKLGEDQSILIETPESESIGFTRTGKVQELAERINEGFEEVLVNQLVNQCRIFVTAFEKIKKEENYPKKIVTEFGLQFNCEGNVYITKASANANFKITFEWEV